MTGEEKQHAIFGTGVTCQPRQPVGNVASGGRIIPGLIASQCENVFARVTAPIGKRCRNTVYIGDSKLQGRNVRALIFINAYKNGPLSPSRECLPGSQAEKHS